MSIRVAVASRDGKFIHQHFGHAEHFLIFEVDSGTFTCVERRDNVPPCLQHDHHDDMLAQAIERIHDCRVVLASRIGPGAQAQLIARGIQPFEVADFIDHALRRLVASGYLRTLLGRGETDGQVN